VISTIFSILFLRKTNLIRYKTELHFLCYASLLISLFRHRIFPQRNEYIAVDAECMVDVKNAGMLQKQYSKSMGEFQLYSYLTNPCSRAVSESRSNIFCMAFFWQICYADPFVRFIFKLIFSGEEHVKEAGPEA
jgi:hypothetical protein